MRLLLSVLLYVGTFNLGAVPTNPIPAILEKLPSLPPVQPNDAAKTFRIQNGFKMELLASEPMVTDPVAMAYDENGLAYVAEMNDYPYTDKTKHEAWKENNTDKPIGRIRVLEDMNGDGKFDKSWIFAEQLSWPSGIVCWKGGVFVTATPDIWYLKDTNGDHKADVRKKVFTGFRKYNVQAVMNNPIWGLDNKIYAAGSGNGGSIVPGEKLDAKPITFLHNDFRFDPVTEKFEVISGGARFGNTFDDLGNRFLCNIRNPAQQVVLENRYLARNPFLPVKTAIHDSAAAGDSLPIYRISPVEPWRELRGKRWTAEDKKIPRSELTGGGVFTSASGITIYRGAAYPSEFWGHAFLGEVANNVIYHQTMVADGVVFRAERAEKNVEFVASTDTWFRPVNFVNAPDGTLHVLDMYRETIEHPWSIPDDIREQLDLQSGMDRGRIYRLAPPNFKIPNGPKLGKVTTAELVATLENPNAWWRETAQRLIFERQDQAAASLLRNLLNKSSNSLARLQALWCLEGLNALRDQDVALGLSDKSAGVRENAIKLADTRFAESPELLRMVISLAGDSEIRVRFQAAFSLGETKYPKIASALLAIAKRDPENPWMRAAVLSCQPDICVPLVELLLKDETFVTNQSGQNLLRQMTFVLGAQNKTQHLYEILAAYNSVPYCACDIQESFMGGLGDGLRQAGKNFRTAFPNAESMGANKMDSVLSEAAQLAQSQTETFAKRREAIHLLGYEEFEKAKGALSKLLDAHEPQEIQAAAVRALAGFKNAEVPMLLLNPWRSFTPAIREEVLVAIFSRKERLKPLLDAIEDGNVSVAQINQARKTMLLAQTVPALHEQAAKLFGRENVGSRKEVLGEYHSALSLKGDKARGQKVFESNCMVCHRSGDKGNEVGPNLETVRQWDAEKIMMNILDPNREVAPNFVSYEIELKDGSSLSGIIISETAGSISLKRSDGIQETVLRQNIQKISSSGLSLMPEGLEAAVPPHDMADLIAFLLHK
ncbi:MAG: PVC-type heme-binding CxxCH protein [Verrucomicrobiota bacterium]